MNKTCLKMSIESHKIQLNLCSTETCTDLTNNTQQSKSTLSHQSKDKLVTKNLNECVTPTKDEIKLNSESVRIKSYKGQDSPQNSGNFFSVSSDNFDTSSNDESSRFSLQSSDSEINELQEVANNEETVQSSNDVYPDTNKGKKRMRNVDNWLKVKAKFLKNSGERYISFSTGKIVEAKHMKPPCSDKCILSCSKKIAENVRSELFEEYWQLASFQRQREFLSSCIEQAIVKYRRISSTEPRQPNCAFYFTNNSQKVRVCKTFLINTLGITERTIRTVIQSKLTGTVIEDKRGKHGNRRKTNEDILKSVRDHINSIPRVESPYARNDTSREFLDGALSISELHRHYATERSSASKPAARYDIYARVFHTEFNLEFFVPKKDRCDICEFYKNAARNDKQNLENKYYQEHVDEQILCQNEEECDKERATKGEIVLAICDLQAVLPIPVGQVSAFSYNSRMSCYNFTITETEKDKSCCFFWHEGLGHRGATEIGSCVLLYFEELAKNMPGIDVVFYSDNCGCLQKNRFIIAMYLYAVERFEINSITHKYLLQGHCQNEGDAIQNVIERSVKKATKSGPVYVPSQYVSLIRNAKNNGNPLRVREMSFGDFLDLKALYDEMSPNISKNVVGKELKINEVSLLKFEKGSNVFCYKTSFKQLEWDSVEFKPKNMNSFHAKAVKDINTRPAYTKNIPLSDNKINDLKSLVNNNIIPAFYKYFYDSIC